MDGSQYNMANTIKFNVQTKVLPTKGNLVYEYNPFRNYRLSQNKFEYQGQLYTEQEVEDNCNIIIDKTYEVIPNVIIENGVRKAPTETMSIVQVSIASFKDGSYKQYFRIKATGLFSIK